MKNSENFPTGPLDDLLLAYLRGLHDAEERLVEILPRWADDSSRPGVRHRLREEFRRANLRLQEMDSAFAALGLAPTSTPTGVTLALENEVDSRLQPVSAGAKDMVILTGVEQLKANVEVLTRLAGRLAELAGHTKVARIVERNLENKSADLSEFLDGAWRR